tara:strand:- start:634 stop:1611 length:978 start_codon:yes stop_codon:yes gene_type:complete
LKFDTVYIEESCKNTAMTKQILSRLTFNDIVLCDNYKEVFNPSNQNFRIQKMNPSLIIAKKKGNFILKTPKRFTIGYKNNYYFSHMLNCIYDCKYCYLQGMYSSANMVLFTNFEDFKLEIEKTIKNTPGTICFFSGYECDSLALDKITNFSDHFINFFKPYSSAYLELRTKSINFKPLLKNDVNPNIILALGLNPEEVVKNFEFKTSSLNQRIKSIQLLQKKGWKIGLRFDPLLEVHKFRKVYSDFFKFVFSSIDVDKVHSITLGNFRMPKDYLKKLVKLRSDESYLFQNVFNDKDNTKSEGQSFVEYCYNEILKYCSKEKIYIN